MIEEGEVKNMEEKASKLAYVRGESIRDIDVNALTLVAQFENNLTFNSNEGIYYYDREGKVTFESYAQVKTNALRVLQGLKKAGLDHGDMVIFQSHRCKDFIDTFWACMYGGMIPVLATLPKSLSNIEATDSLTVLNVWKMLDKAKIIVSDDVFSEYEEFSNHIGIDMNSLINIESLRDKDEAELTYEVRPEDTSMMFFTSGSTGMPKGVIQINRNAVLREYGHEQLNHIKKDVLLNWMPLEHAGGVLMAHFRGIMSHSRQVLVETDYILENPMRWLELIDKHRVNYSWAPHFAYVLINDLVDEYQGKLDLSCVEILLDGGEMVHASSGKEFLKKLKKFNMKSSVIQPSWGMCETCSGVMYNLEFDQEEMDGVQIVAKDMSKGVLADTIEDGDYVTAIGVPIPGCEAMVTNSDNEVLPEDTIGRFLFRGESVTTGYYKNDEVNRESFTDDKWFVTGDLGFIHDGKMYLTGREKDIIIINGLNYNNVEIEAVIEDSGKVEKSFTAVCAVQDQNTKQDIIVAFIVPKPGYDIDLLREEIKSEVFNKIKLNISYIIPVDKESIPKTNLGKIQRAKLGKKFAEGEFAHLVDNVVGNQKIYEKIEKELQQKLNVSDIVIMQDTHLDEMEYISSERLNLGYKKVLGESKEEGNIKQEEIKEAVEKIEGIKKSLISEQSNRVVIYFETGIKEAKFNKLMVKKIDEMVQAEFQLNDCIYIPVSLSEVGQYTKETLDKLMNEGYFEQIQTDIMESLGKDDTIPQWFYEEEAIKCSFEHKLNSEEHFRYIVCNNMKILESYAEANQEKKDSFVVVTADTECMNKANELGLQADYVDIYDKNSYEKIVQKWSKPEDVIDIVHLAGCDVYECETQEKVEKAQYMTVISVQNLLQATEKLQIQLNIALIMTKNVLSTFNECNNNYIISTISGYVKAAFDEGFSVKHVDFDGNSVGKLIEIIDDELAQLDYNQVLYRNSERYRIGLKQIDICEYNNDLVIKENGHYLITGGLGGVGVEISAMLLERFHANLLLVGRSELTEGKEELQARYSSLTNIANGKGSIQYKVCDIGNGEKVETLIADYENATGHQLDGIIHLAGGVIEKLIKDQTPEELLSLYQAKVFGTNALLEVVKKHPSILFITTSSARSLLPGISVSSYSSASEFNAHLAVFARKVLGVRATCISWSQWDEIGMSKGLVVKSALEEKGFKLIAGSRGVDSFILALSADKPYIFLGLDCTKKSIKKLIESKKDTKKGVVIYTSYKNALEKEDQFKEEVLNVVNKYSELSNDNKEIRLLVSLPLDKNGFVDKATLKERERFLLGDAHTVQPRNEYEKKVFKCWETVFKSVQFGVMDNFFKLGGDSIKMIRLISILSATFHVKIKNQDMFKLTSIEQQANFIREMCKKNAVEEKEELAQTQQKEDLVAESKGTVLSAPQMRQWIMYKMDPDSPYYNNTVAIKIKGTVIIPCLKMAIHQLIQRHDILRTIYKEDGDKIYQTVEDTVNIEIEQVDLTQYGEDSDAKLEQLYREEANKIMRIDKELPIRATILSLQQNEVVLLMSIHHIASDGWSMGVLLKDLSAIYSDIMTNGISKLPKLTMQYAAFAKWQREFLRGEEYQRQIHYWKKELEDMPPALELPYDEERKDYSENKGKRIVFEIDQETTNEIRKICKTENSTLYMFLMSIFANLMQRYSNQNDMILGTLIANRNQEEFQKMIGFFVNTMPIRLSFDENETFLGLLSQVKNKTLEMYDNQDVPFDVLVDELGTERESGKNPLFQVLFVVQNAQIESLKDNLAEWDLQILDSDTSKFDLIVQVFENENKLFVKYEYDTNLFHDSTMERWCRHFKHLITEVIKEPDKKVGDYDVIDEDERKQILQINDNRTDYARESNMYEMFSQVCERTPDHIALSSGSQYLTYAETKYKVDCMAAYLQKQGVKHGEVVMIVADKTVQVVIGMLAILKNGCAYLPLSPKYPNDFVQYIVENSGTRYVLCNQKYEERECFAGLNKIMLDREYSADDSVVYEKINPDDKAYVIYTSGSTGNPKGVVVKQQSVMRLVNKTNIYDFGEKDIILQSGSLTFDVSITEVWGAILNGSHLRLVDEDIALDTELFKKEILESKPTFMWISAPLFSMLVETDETLFETVKTLMVGGDVVSPKATNKVRKHNPDTVIINGYGPTENTSFSTIYNIVQDFNGPIPIGHPVSNSTAYVVNKNMKLQPIGVMGELIVGGDGVALGYLNNPELTDKLFKPNPFEPGKMMYLTGDYASVKDDGEIAFFGRIDGQVKVRGFRIELSAIERMMLEIEGVEQVLVRCIGGNDDKKIVAYYTGKEVEDIRSSLGEKLPEYMIPSYIKHLDQIPLNKNGKVDTKNLPDVTQIEQSSQKEYVQPETATEKEIYDIWARVLNTSNFSINDNFFKLGGDSIMVIQLTNLIKQSGYDISTKQFFKYQTIRQLALHINKNTVNNDEGAVSGQGILGPIQKWFFEQEYSNMNLWNLPVMLHLDKKHDKEVVRKALQEVVSYHDCLKSKFTRIDGEYHQIFGENSSEPQMDVIDLQGVADKKDSIIEACKNCQKLIDIEKGNMVSAVLFENEDTQQLFIAVHHLVVDGISLRIIGEDILQAIEDIEGNRAINMMKKTSSFMKWNEKLNEYAQSSKLQEEYAFWKKVNDQIESFIKVDSPNTEENSSTMLYVLDKSTTELFKNVNRETLGIDINQLLITSLVKTFHEVFNMQNISIKLEGHGREDILDDIDVFRTVGWFTTSYPVVFHIDDSNNLSELLLNCKENLMKIKNSGIGYGVLKYLTKAEEVQLVNSPQVVFNYLGDVDKKFEIGSREYGIFRDPGYVRDTYMEFNIILQDGELLLYLTLHNELIKDEKFATVLEKYASNIKLLLNYCQEVKDKIYSASDFEFTDLDNAQVKEILDEYGMNLKDIYPLSYSQKGMLYHYMMNEESEDYFGQVHCPMYGTINKECFEKAWNQVVQNNDILTTVYKWEGLFEPVQIVLDECSIPIEYIDTRNQDISEEEYFEKILEDDRKEPFVLNKFPLVRVKIVEMSKGTEFVFSFPHISLDGWSVFVILGELLKCYRLYANNEAINIYDKKAQYKDYIEWLVSQDMDKMKNYWKEYMDGFEEKNHLFGIDDEVEENNDFIQETFVLSKEEEERLKNTARAKGVTVNTMLQGALALTLSKFTDATDIIFGTTVSGRTPEVEFVDSVTGLLINTLPFRIQIDEQEKISDFMSRIQEIAINMKDFESMSMAEIKALSKVNNAEELFDVLLVFENYPVDKGISSENNQLSFGSFESHERTNYAITIVVVPGDELLVRFSYIENKVEAVLVNALMNALKNAVMNMCSDAITVQEVELYDEKQKQEIITKWSKNPLFEELFDDQEEIYSVLEDEVVDAAIYILDESLNIAPLGVPGEVYIGINDLDAIQSDWTDWMDKNKVKNPLSADKYEYLYKTGDIGMWVSERKIHLFE